MTKLISMIDRASIAWIDLLVVAGLPLAALALATNAL